MGEFLDRVFPSYNAAKKSTDITLATATDGMGNLVRTANPPNVTPTSPLSGQPITVVQVARDNYAGGTVSRSQFLNIPAAHGVYSLLTNVAAGLPLQAINPAGDRISSPLLEQPERNYPRTVTMARTYGDMLLHGMALWVVTERVARFPSKVIRVSKEKWSQAEDGTIKVQLPGMKRAEAIDPANIIMFPSNEENGILSVCTQPVQMYYALQRARRTFLDNPQAREYFQGGPDSPEQAEVWDFLEKWKEARREGVTGYVPYGVTLEQINMMTPEQLAMKSAEESIIGDFARAFNIEPAMLALAITTRQYSNIVDDRRQFLDFNLMPNVINPVEQRLSMDDVFPHGTKVRANTDAFLRTDTKERYEAYAIGLTNGFITLDEVRETDNRPPLPAKPETPAIAAPAPEVPQ